MRKLWIASILAASSLSGCQTIQPKCPPLHAYSPAEQKHLAGEFGALPPDVRSAMNDYLLLRDECRAF